MIVVIKCVFILIYRVLFPPGLIDGVLVELPAPLSPALPSLLLECSTLYFCVFVFFLDTQPCAGIKVVIMILHI